MLCFSEARGGGADIAGQLVNTRIRMENGVNVYLWVGGRTTEIIMMCQRANARWVGQRNQPVNDNAIPFGISRSVRKTKLRIWNTGANGIGELQPLVHIGVRVPGFRITDRRSEAVRLIADLEVLKLLAERFIDERGFFGRELRRVGAEIHAIQAGPSRGVEKRAEVTNGV